MSDKGYSFCDVRKIPERKLGELVGLCKGIMADGELVTTEAEFLLEWLKKQKLTDIWPGNQLADKLAVILEDGIVDQVEQDELSEIIGTLIS